MSILDIVGIAQAAAQEVMDHSGHNMAGMEEWTTYTPLVVARWIHFASVYVLFGSAFFWFYMPREHSLAHPGQLKQTLAATTLMLRIATPVAAVSGWAWLGCMLINMTSDVHAATDLEDWRLLFFETPFSTVCTLRCALLALAVVVAFLPRAGRLWYSSLMHIGALLLISQAWLGHAAQGGAGLYGVIMIIAYAVHMLASAAWVGGLPPLLFGLVEQRRFDLEHARECTLDILSRFSAMAIVAVTLLVATGITNAGFRVAGSFGKLFYTEYGNALITKIAIVSAMLALAYFNRFVATPLLRRTSLEGITKIVWLGRSVTVELVLGVLVLGAASVLGITPPPQ